MTLVVLFHRDLRVSDHPALAEACRSGHDVVPLFVLDPGVLDRTGASANRAAFLVDSLADLRRSLRQRGGELYLRHGDPVAETMKVAAAVDATAVFLAGDVSRYARNAGTPGSLWCATTRRSRALPGGHRRRPRRAGPGRRRPLPGLHAVLEPMADRCASARRGRAHGHPGAGGPPRRPDPVSAPPESRADLAGPRTGGETIGKAQARSWMRRHLSSYADAHNDLAGDRTSPVSPYLHFGCVSGIARPRGSSPRRGGAVRPPTVLARLPAPGHAAFPDLPYRDYRPRRGPGRDDPVGLTAWKDGQTGIPIVDAGMRQLRLEGWMHNRARLLVASFLTRDLGIAWQRGAHHFLEWLVDGDIANNSGNWQWVAGTGNDTRPNRRFNVIRQALRYDADGSYVRRYVPELAGIAGPAVHQPWMLREGRGPGVGYPAPICDPPTPR